ncbi:MAG: phage holin family protein [Niallia sp.]
MEWLQSFLLDHYYILVPVLWIIGYALKQTPIIPDWSIIWILLLASILLATFAYGLSFEAVTNGIIAAGVSVFGHQLAKQTIQKNVSK